MNVIATIVEDPDTTPMSVRLPTKEEKILPKEEVGEKNHHCRGFVMADVLVKGLSRGAIATG